MTLRVKRREDGYFLYLPSSMPNSAYRHDAPRRATPSRVRYRPWLQVGYCNTRAPTHDRRRPADLAEAAPSPRPQARAADPSPSRLGSSSVTMTIMTRMHAHPATSQVLTGLCSHSTEMHHGRDRLGGAQKPGLHRSAVVDSLQIQHISRAGAHDDDRRKDEEEPRRDARRGRPKAAQRA